ncbi:MAG: hypothetical protein ACXAC7_24160, partial [Candidatus Hodarchaeales archaeon]
MLDIDINRIRKHVLALIIGIFFIFLFYSNRLWTPNRLFGVDSVIYFDSLFYPDYLSDLMQKVGLLLPYLVVLLLIGIIFFYYANLIKRGFIRKLLKVALIIFLVLSVWFIAGQEILNEIYGRDPSTDDETVTTDTTSTTTSTPVETTPTVTSV